MQSIFKSILLAILTFISLSQADNSPVKVYTHGTILTMSDAMPQAEAVAVKDGRILAVGTKEEVEKKISGRTETVDLEGKTMMPGFIDAHSHLALVGTKLALANMSNPPAGPITSIEDIQEGFKAWIKKKNIRPGDGKIAAGWGYDHTQLVEHRHPTRDDLDKISKEIPIVLIHFSTHQCVLNSAALELFKIDANTPDPEGGRILRYPGSNKPNGILQEAASIPIKIKIFGADYEEKKRRILAAQHFYMQNGFTTAQEAALLDTDWADAFRHLGRDGQLKIDVDGIAFFKTADQLLENYQKDKDYKNHFRLAGVKLILDGGSPGRSAFLRDPYYRQKEGEHYFRGVALFPKQSDVDAMFEKFYKNDWQVFVHALGDAAIDQALNAIENAEKKYPAPKNSRRTQVIHAQLFHQDQMERMKKLDATVTFQNAHVYYFGDFHRKETFGPQLAENLCPMRQAIDNGLSVTIHHDAPVHPADQFFLIWNAVNRTTRSGYVLGANQRIGVMDALKASTISAAYQLKEEKLKGSIEAGKMADFIVLSDNPLEIDPMRIKDIKVLETIKEGGTVYKAGGEEK